MVESERVSIWIIPSRISRWRVSKAVVARVRMEVSIVSKAL